MRNLIAAALLLSPLALAAQANSPASTPASNLQARLADPAFAAATPNEHPTAPVRVSTGVVAPKLVKTVAIQADERSIYAIAGLERKITVSMIVDEKGVPNDLKVIESQDPASNPSILSAVSQYRFTPGTLSSQPAAVPVNLEIIVRPSR